MKIHYQIQGRFYRQLVEGNLLSDVSLWQLLQEIQAVATQTHRRTPQLLHQSFGLEFIPNSVLTDLLKIANGLTQEDQLYQSSSLKLLFSRVSNLKESIANRYIYQFISSEITLDLLADDPQFPLFNGSETQQDGSYTVVLDQSYYPGLSLEIAEKIWQEAETFWQNLPNYQKIDRFLRSIDTQEAVFRINDQLRLGINWQELPLSLREAMISLREGNTDISDQSESTQRLIQEYQDNYRIIVSHFPENPALKPNLSPVNKIWVSRENRTLFQKIIAQAEKFLLISSYILEDEALINQICEKSATLPQGVWILTDLRDEVVDRIDQQVTISDNLPEHFKRADERKKDCLRQLLDAKVKIRSGAFHLKTCISENHGYLGSMNLTRGSLDVNLESGMICQNNETHQQLINVFRYFWQSSSRDHVIPVLGFDGFELRTIKRYRQESYPVSSTLLTPSQYYNDLLKELSDFEGKVIIVSRSFQATAELRSQLQRLNSIIYIDQEMRFLDSTINIKRVKNIHAKITILGNKIAYIGGINFNFSLKHQKSYDLMYKTTDSQEISQIISTLKGSKS
ncbi:MAG: phospholipase D-like domain-containing protein [Planktothrix sp.]|uniref:phospholipase D-like domain-containing protein n=1 Tax=Planktothrix sp. TaxID=3088171 RepID=UPI0038D35D51